MRSSHQGELLTDFSCLRWSHRCSPFDALARSVRCAGLSPENIMVFHGVSWCFCLPPTHPSAASRLAPCRSSTCTHAAWPAYAAWCSGVRPLSSTASTAAPCASSTCGQHSTEGGSCQFAPNRDAPHRDARSGTASWGVRAPPLSHDPWLGVVADECWHSHSIKETVHYPPTFVCPQSPELRIGAGRANAAELDCCCRRR